MSKIAIFFRDFLRDIRQMFVDQTDVIDDKRVAGLALIASGIVYIWTRSAALAPLDYGQIVLGLGTLGVSLASDKIAAGMASITTVVKRSEDNPTQGVPQ